MAFLIPILVFPTLIGQVALNVRAPYCPIPQYVVVGGKYSQNMHDVIETLFDKSELEISQMPPVFRLMIEGFSILSKASCFSGALR